MTTTNSGTNGVGALVAAQSATVAPDAASSDQGPTRRKASPQGRKTAKAGRATVAPKQRPSAGQGKADAKTIRRRPAGLPRAKSKAAKILALIQSPKGASLAEIMKATHWQAHSVRGFLSTATKRYNLKLTSVENQSGERVYRIIK